MGIRVRDMRDGDWWAGNIKGDSNIAMFRKCYVNLNERPVLRFDLVATPDPESKEQVTACIMLMQRNIAYERKFRKMEETGLNYKETTYPEMELIVVRPDGEVAIRKKNRKRCVWGEVTMPGGGNWRIYALCASGEGAPAIVRIYLKGGT